MTERRRKLRRFGYPVCGTGWLLLGLWHLAGENATTGWSYVGLGVACLCAGAHFEWKLRREKRLSELREELGDDSAGQWWAADEHSAAPVTGVVARSAGSASADRRRGLFGANLTVVRFRVLAAWRKALSEKGKLVFAGALAVFLLVNLFFASASSEQGPPRDLPVDPLFAIVAFFVVMTLLQLAPLAPWFDRRAGVRFGLSAARRAALTTGTNVMGLTLVLVLLNEALALGLWGAGWPRGPEWAFEGMDVAGAVAAMIVAGPVGAVILGAGGRRRWLGAGLGLLLLTVLAASAVEPLWAAEAVWAQGAVSGGRLLALLALLAAAFALEQRSPDDRGAGKKWNLGWRASRRQPQSPSASLREKPSGAASAGRAPAGIRARPVFVFALAEARMMLRFRQVRLNLILSWIMPVFMAIVLRGEESAVGEDGGQFALWMASGLGALLCVFWIAFFANLLGFTADGVRRLSMSAERALGACLPGKVLGLVAVVGGLVLLQLAAAVWLLAERIPAADRPIPFLIAGCSLVGLAGAGTSVSIWLPRRPKLHEQRDLYSSVLALGLLGSGWLVLVSVFGGAAAAARLLAGSGTAVVTMTVLLLVSAGGCSAFVATLAKGDWLRRRLREWAVTA